MYYCTYGADGVGDDLDVEIGHLLLDSGVYCSLYLAQE